MTYLIIYNGEAFYTNWYEFENNYRDGMIVVNLLRHTVTFDGINWDEIQQDHL